MAHTPRKGGNGKPFLAYKEDVREVSEAVVALREDLVEVQEVLSASIDSKVQAASADISVAFEKATHRLEAFIRDAGAAAERACAVAAELPPRLEELEEATKALEARQAKDREAAAAEAERGGRELRQASEEARSGLAGLREELRAQVAETLSGARAHAEERVQAVAAGAPSHGQLQERLEALESRMLRHVEESLAALGDRLGADLASSSRRQQGALDDLAEALRREASELDAAARDSGRKELSRLEAAQAAQFDRHGTRLGSAEKEVNRCFEELERLEVELERAAAETRAVRGDAEQQLAAVQLQSSRRLGRLEARVGHLREHDSSGIPTRQVDWRLEPGILEAWRAPAAAAEGDSAGARPQRGLFSPPFQLCGRGGLQLELRPCSGRRSSRHEDGHGPGDCSVFLWAPRALRLTCRVTAAGESAVLRSGGPDGPADGGPCGAKGLFSLPRGGAGASGGGAAAEQEEGGGEHLCVTLEVLEATCEKAIGGGPGAVRSAAADGAATLQEGAGAAEAADSDEEDRGGEGSLTLQRHVNHQLLDLVQSNHRGLSEFVQRKVDTVRSRAIRRVQWRLDQAVALRQYFGEGRPICSTAFQAAGIPGMQLVFYPSGCSGAKDGFCSFFVSCPAGCTLRCWLWAGRWRREARSEPAEKHDLLGRANFCRFEACVDPIDGSVELALEIQEAQQLVPGAAETCGPVPLESVSMPGGGLEATTSMSASGNSTLNSTFGSPSLDRTDVSSVKLQPHPLTGRPASSPHETRTERPEHVQQLPAIWTSHGFRSFAELQAGGASRGNSRPPTSARGRTGSITATCDSLLLPHPSITSPHKTMPKLFSDTARMPAVPAGHKYKEYSP